MTLTGDSLRRTSRMSEREEIKKKVLEKSKDGKIPCKTALEIADELKVHPREVGEVINELGIKIVACQLGCFK